MHNQVTFASNDHKYHRRASHDCIHNPHSSAILNYASQFDLPSNECIKELNCMYRFMQRGQIGSFAQIFQSNKNYPGSLDRWLDIKMLSSPGWKFIFPACWIREDYHEMNVCFLTLRGKHNNWIHMIKDWYGQRQEMMRMHGYLFSGVIECVESNWFEG